MKEATLHELIEASPFEAHKNMGGKLTQEVFFNEFLVGKDHFNNQMKKLLYYIDPNKSDRSIIFLYGYSGIGKTTFLHWFILTNEQSFNHIYLSVTREDTSLARISDSADPKLGIITETVIRKVRELLDIKEFPKFISFLTSYPQFIESDEFFTLPTKRVINECIFNYRNETLANESRLKFFEEMKFKDAFIVMFIILLRKQLKTKKKTIIYFDNLDLAEVDLITKEFEAIFFGLFDIVKRISENDQLPFYKFLRFSRDFKFVFCLRDINYSLLNVHLREISRSNTAELKFEVFPISHEIFERRLSLIPKYCNSSYEIGTVDSMKIMNKDDYVRTLLGPLFNFDYRKVSAAIYDFHYPRTNAEQPFNASIYQRLYKFERSLSRGLLIFRLLRYLNDRYIKYFMDESLTPVGGRCSPHRMLLQLVLNKSDYSVEDGHRINSEVRLNDVIKTFEGIYDKTEIFRLLRLYYYTGQRSNWSHLLSFSGSNIHFDEILGNKSIGEINYNALRRINLSITPSGFIYIRYLITHFEYYLFMIKAKKSLPEMLAFSGNNFEFELYIETAFKKVKLHCEWMSHFYKMKFKGKFDSPKEYKISDYSWKYIKDKLREDIKYGQFHSERLITSHVSYLDRFRMFCLKGDSGIDRDHLLLCNRKLVEYIYDYYCLFENCIDNLDMIEVYIEFKKSIDKIRDSLYSDFDTLILKKPLLITS